MISNDETPMGSNPAAASKPRSLTLGQILAVEAKLKRGLPVSDEERRQHAAANEAFNSAMKGFQDSYVGVMDQLRPALSKLPELLLQVGQWQKAILDRIAPVFAEMAVAFREMPPRLQSALMTLGGSGWYLDGELGLSELWELEGLLLGGEATKVDSMLTQHYEGRLQEIEDFLVKSLPRREKILRAAFAAHLRGEFELSVPVLLAQSDGACLDLTGYHFFIKESGKPKAARYVADVERDAFSIAMLIPLQRVLPINASESDRNRMVQDRGLPSWQELNRHLVLHGESFDYGTQTNSLKAVSLINYLVGFLGKANDT